MTPQLNDLLLFKFNYDDACAPNDEYRAFGYFLKTDLPHSKVYEVSLCIQDGSNNPLKVYHKEIVKNFGQVLFEDLEKDYPEWVI